MKVKEDVVVGIPGMLNWIFLERKAQQGDSPVNENIMESPTKRVAFPG